MSTKADVVVLGGGPAGCAAAIDLARQGCEVLIKPLYSNIAFSLEPLLVVKMITPFAPLAP